MSILTIKDLNLNFLFLSLHLACLLSEVYQRQKALAKTRGFQSSATASVAKGSSPNLQPLVRLYIFLLSIILKDVSEYAI